MRASFFEFTVAMTALNTARANTATAGHNMANSVTPGFSRQVVNQQAATPLNTFNRVGMFGTGSQVLGISQIRNVHLDSRYWNESAMLGRQFTTNLGLTLIERRFTELDDQSFTVHYNDVFSALSDLQTDPSNPTYRNAFIQALMSKNRNFASQAEGLRQHQLDINSEIAGTVTLINSLGERIAALNLQIDRAELHGGVANDLRDQRAALVDQLSGLVNITTSETTVEGRGRFSMHINGQEFISHDNVTRLFVQRRETPLQETDAAGLYDIYFDLGRGTSIPFAMYSRTLSGQLRGLLDVRDGNSLRDDDGNILGPLDFRGIPYYFSQLNIMVNTVANAFNLGIGKDGNPIPGMVGHESINPPGIPLFVGGIRNTYEFVPSPGTGAYNHIPAVYVELADGEVGDWSLIGGVWVETPGAGTHNLIEEERFELADPPGTGNYNREILYSTPYFTVWNIAVNPAILADQSLLQTSTNPSLGESDASLITAFLQLQYSRDLFAGGTLFEFITSFTSDLAMDVRDAGRLEAAGERITYLVHNQRLQIKGVDVNEEMMNVLHFQQVFNAASRLITIINDIYDNMINRMGVS